MKPEKPNKPRSAPGMNEAAKRGAANTFRHIPNQSQKGKTGGKGGCLRCGDPSHHWKECPRPFRGKLDPRIVAKAGYGAKGESKGKPIYVDRDEKVNQVPEQQSPPEAEVPAHGQINPEGLPTADSPEGMTHIPSINDVWAQYYAQFHEIPTTVAVCSTNESTHGTKQPSPIAAMMAKTSHKADDLPPILIDSGASSSVAGTKWPQSWKGFSIPHSPKATRNSTLAMAQPTPASGPVN